MGLVALQAELSGLDGYVPLFSAMYLDRLQARRRRKASTTSKAEVEDNAFATFYAEGAAARAPAAALGDAYAVALQRFLGELTRRGAIAGGGGGRPPTLRKNPRRTTRRRSRATPIRSSRGSTSTLRSGR